VPRKFDNPLEHKLYRLWVAIRSRCFSQSSRDYKKYGEKGISVEEPWASSFDSFKNDMLPSASMEMTLDRKNPNGNYCKENCRWIPHAWQARNRGEPKNNTSGKTGLACVDDGRGGRHWRAYWSDPFTFSQKSVQFSVRKYGYDEARAMAEAIRDAKLQELLLLGMGYTDFHGKTKEVVSA